MNWMDPNALFWFGCAAVMLAFYLFMNRQKRLATDPVYRAQQTRKAAQAEVQDQYTSQNWDIRYVPAETAENSQPRLEIYPGKEARMAIHIIRKNDGLPVLVSTNSAIRRDAPAFAGLETGDQWDILWKYHTDDV